MATLDILPGPDTSPDPSIHADEEAVMLAFLARKPVDPAVGERVRERSLRISEEILRKFGVLNIAVPAIRELRGPQGAVRNAVMSRLFTLPPKGRIEKAAGQG